MTAQLKLQIVVDEKGVRVIDQFGEKVRTAAEKGKAGFTALGQSTAQMNSYLEKSISLYHQLAVAAGALYTLKQGWDVMKTAAKAAQEKQAFESLAASYGSNADKIVSDLKRASASTIDTMTLIEKAGTAMMMGINPEEISNLMEIARATSHMTGQSVTEAFSDISLAVGKQSKMILDNLGIIVRVEEAYKTYAAELGKTQDELTEVEKKQAFLNATLSAGSELMIRVGDQAKTLSEQFQSMEAFVSDLKVMLGEGLLLTLKSIAVGFSEMGAIVNRTLEQIAEGWGYIMKLLAMLPGGRALGFKSLSVELERIASYFRGLRIEAEGYVNALLKAPLSGAAPSERMFAGASAAVITPTVDKDAADKAADKWLRNYLDASEAAWKAEVERNERIGDLVNVEMEWQKEKWAKEEKWAEDAQKAYVKVVDDRVKAEAVALEKQQKEWQHYWENVQDFTADTFYDLFKNIDDGWQGLLDRMKDWFLRWAAEIAAKAVVVNLQGVFGSNMATSGTGAGGIMNMLGIGKDIYSLAGGGGTSLYSMLGGAGGAGATFAGVGAAEAAAAAAGYGGLAGATRALGAAGAAEFGVGASAATSAGMGMGMTAAAAIPYIGAAIAAAGIIYSIASKEKEKKYPVQPIELSGYSGGITGNLWSGTGPYTEALNKGYTDVLNTTNEQIVTMIGSLSETQAKRAEEWLESYAGTAMRGGQVLKAGDSIESVLAEFGDAMESVYAGLVSSLGFDSAEAMAEYIGKVSNLIEGSQSAIASAINAGLQGGGLTTFETTLRESIYNATMQGLIDAFVSETVMGQAFAPFMRELQAAMDYSMSTGVFNAGAFMYLMQGPLAEMSATINSLAPAFALFSSISEQFQSAIGMQGGGVISEPITGIGRSGQLYRFGEAGPETVIPGTGGGTNVTIIKAGVITTNDVDAWMADRMRKLGRRGHIAARNEIVTAGLK